MYRLVLALSTSLSVVAHAATLTLSNPYGELVDRNDTLAYYEASYPDRVDCSVPPLMTRSDAAHAITITARRVPRGAQVPQCLVPNQASLGVLEAGWWTVTLRVVDTDGTTTVEQIATDWLVSAPDTLCGREPGLLGGVIAAHRTLDAAQLAQRIASDPAFAAALRHPSEVRPLGGAHALLNYDATANAYDNAAAVLRTGEFTSASANGYACFAPSPPDRYGDVVEYYHAALGHYFYTVDASEIAGLDGGTGAQGWVRTGKSFHVLVQPGCLQSRRDQVAYRFFGKPGVGPSSHVFTVDRRECRTVAESGAWLFESAPFYASPIDRRGGCLAGGVPLYRVWKPFGDSNHRFTTDRRIVDEMSRRGWVDEGPAMCVAG